VQALRLRSLALGARIGLTAALAVLAIGLLASLRHLSTHHSKNDGAEGLSTTDIRGAYHGVEVQARLAAVLARAERHPPELSDEEHGALRDWLGGERLLDGYDDLELDLLAPAEILAARCVQCHARGSGVPQAEQLPLEYWDDVARVVETKRITPTPEDILVLSLHTHATALGVLVIAVGLLACWTRFPSFLRSLPLGLGGLGLLADIGGQWLARGQEGFVWAILGGGAAFGIAMALGLVLAAAELWLPAERGSAERRP
jgi:hypothetical protein